MKYLILIFFMIFTNMSAADSSCPTALNTLVRKLHSNDSANLCSYFQAHKALLIVNTASHCGYTKQFSGLEGLYQKYKEQGLVVLGFPSNSFNQEESDEEGTARICFENFGVSFPMFEHVDVEGTNAHPLFSFLAERSEKPSWNFNKYLIIDDKVLHFGSDTTPLNSPLEDKIKQNL